MNHSRLQRLVHLGLRILQKRPHQGQVLPFAKVWRSAVKQFQPGCHSPLTTCHHRRQQLSSDCKAAMFDEETTMGESIDFQYPMKTACQQVCLETRFISF